MKLKNRITDDVKSAMKQRDVKLLGVLRMATAAIKQVEVDTKKQVSDDDVVKIIRKMVKQRKESLAQYLKAQRQDLADTESFEIEVLMTYMPDPISEADLAKIVDEAIQSTAAESSQQIGLVIKELKAKFGAELDLAKASQLVKNKLSI
tara:strand:+ start:57 stop:503 length:447 start_codon:yes stop_codon:yes gene_type:complete